MIQMSRKKKKKESRYGSRRAVVCSKEGPRRPQLQSLEEGLNSTLGGLEGLNSKTLK
jgi:hypothetical protein